MIKKVLGKLWQHKVVFSVVTAFALGITGVAIFYPNAPVVIKDELVALAAGWPSAFDEEGYQEPPFADDANRTNNAFNVADFGEQGHNGWFYRYGSADKPFESKQIESFDGEKYFQLGYNGLEVKSNFIHTSEGAAPILEWRAAEDGAVNVQLTYVKNVNGDKNPSYPDGVVLYIYKGEEALGRYEVDISTDKEELLEEELKDIELKEDESLYFAVDPNMNNAYDGGSLYVAINDVNAKGPSAVTDTERTDNNANNIEDYDSQGKNGWTYLCGKGVSDAHLVSTRSNNEYMNVTSPNLVISESFIHPAINDAAMLCWQPATDGQVELRCNYTKFEQNDGNPDWPDGVTVKVYKNSDLLFEQKVMAPKSGNKTVNFRQARMDVTTQDKFYFVVDSNNNASYDGGCFDITFLDRTGAQNENDITIDTSETRQNFADVKYDFGKQGYNGWFYQEGYQDEPFDTINMKDFDTEEDRYFEDSYLEIKRDFVNTGKGKSAVIKWQVAQTGTIAVDASYTKFKNEDKNPSWPDGTRVSLYHNSTLLLQEEFAPDTENEITKQLDVDSLEVTKGDYIVLVVNGKDNNAYDGGKYEFAIRGITPLTGTTENDVTYSGGSRTNNASCQEDFGKQGSNGWAFQSGYYLDPYFAVNLETYQENEKYTTIDGVEIKRDYIMPGNKGRSANVKWMAAQAGTINIMASYSKLKNEDANPDWPDGVTVYLMKNNEILKKEDFAPEVDKIVTKDMSYGYVSVQPGDVITLMVDGKENNAYDGGNYTFVVEDAELKSMDMVNNSGKNYANLALDFGEQGSNGWYYWEGRSVDQAEILTKRTDDGCGYVSRKAKNLEVKKDFVQPRLNAHAMYKWVVAVDGQIDITGYYEKFGHEDPNVNWPDGVTVNVYLNGGRIFDDVCSCPRGDDRSNRMDINFTKLDVHAGDIITFDVGCNKNNAWDGGKFDIDIADSNAPEVVVGDDERTNNTSLGRLQSLAQGTDGWWFLEGNSPEDAKVLTYMNEDETAYLSTKNKGLEIKKDFVHPGENAGAIYQWVVYEDGKIDLLGDYVKFGQNDANPDWPDGVKVRIYHNDQLLDEYDVAVFQGDGNDNKIDFMYSEMEVAKGDKLTFVIDAKDNNAYDAGRLSVNIYEYKEPDPEDPEKERTNNTNLKDSFGDQGSDGWYYGMCDWDGANFERLEYDPHENRYYNNGKPELKPDFVEPGNGRNAAYQWVVAETGTIHVYGDYTKFANNEDPYANGTCMRIFINGTEKKWMGGSTQGNFSDERVLTFDEEYNVRSGDVIMFAIDCDGNDSWDGGRLAVTIEEVKDEDEDEEDDELDDMLLAEMLEDELDETDDLFNLENDSDDADDVDADADADTDDEADGEVDDAEPEDDDMQQDEKPEDESDNKNQNSQNDSDKQGKDKEKHNKLDDAITPDEEEN